jgi:hypothetical protein
MTATLIGNGAEQHVILVRSLPAGGNPGWR